MDELKKLLENAGMAEAGLGTTPHIKGANGSTYSVYLDDPNSVTIGKNGSTVATGELSNGIIVNDDIQDPRAVLEALVAWAATFKE